MDGMGFVSICSLLLNMNWMIFIVVVCGHMSQVFQVWNFRLFPFGELEMTVLPYLFIVSKKPMKWESHFLNQPRFQKGDGDFFWLRGCFFFFNGFILHLHSWSIVNWQMEERKVRVSQDSCINLKYHGWSTNPPNVPPPRNKALLRAY